MIRLYSGRPMRTQLALLSGSILILAIGIFSWHAATGQAVLARTATEREMRAMAASLALVSTDLVIRRDLASLDELVRSTVEIPSVRGVAIFNRAGELLFSREKAILGQPAETTIQPKNYLLPEQEDVTVNYLEASSLSPASLLPGIDRRLGLVWIPMKAGGTVGWVRMEFSLDEMNQSLLLVWKSSLVAGGLGIVLGILALFLFLRRPMNALQEATHFAQDLDQRSGKILTSWHGTAEIGALGDALNQVSQKLFRQNREILAQRDSLEVLVGSLTESSARAEEASRAKSEFVANMSHEIRTPLNGILGAAELLRDMELTEPQYEYLEMITSSGEALLVIVNDILDYSKIEVGKLALDTIEFDLFEIVHETIKSISILAAEKKLHLTYEIAPDVPAHLVGDPGRLRQVLLNLIGNAIKFTQRGGIHVLVAEEELGEHLCLHFSVSDSGIGIEPDKLNSIFDAFSQADMSVTRRYGGTGLGLTICRRLVNMMGGRIWVESKVDAGSTFHFTAYFDRGHVSSLKPNLASPFKGLQILVADPSITHRRNLAALLGRHGIIPTVVADADDAIAVLEESRGNTNFQIALLDPELHGRDGSGVLQAIDQCGFTEHISIILMSENFDHGSSLSTLGNRVMANLPKPIDEERLLQTIQRITGVNDNPDPVSSSAENNKLRILVAEDNELNRRLITALLIRDGHQVTTVTNGREAVRLSAEGIFNLVLMDIHMPEMDGYEAIRAIRQRESEQKQQRLPVVALTASALKGDRERALAAGMDGYLTKPIRVEELRSILVNFNHIVGSCSANVPEQQDSNSLLYQAKPQSIILPDIAGFNVTEALARVAGDVDQYFDFLVLFEEDAKLTMEELRVAFAQGRPAVAAYVHNLKGSAGAIGAIGVQAAAERFEHALLSGQGTDRQTECLGALEFAWSAAQDSLAALLAFRKAMPNRIADSVS